MIPVIAIVGRPNVGKSTLFNRLTQSRDALVSDFAGMTRDRQYGTAHIGDRRFIIIDTGGMTNEDDDINKLTTQQATQAIEEADKVLFLVDVRAGITNEDMMIAKKIRALNKNTYLGVNKTEGMDTGVAAAEFYKLGFGQPHAISAVHSNGVNQLIDAMFAEDMVEEETPADEEDQGIKLAVIGKPNVGKSTLINRMLGEERVIVCDLPGTTRGSVFIPLERQGVKYTLIDTAGVRRRGKVLETTEKFSVVKTLQAIEATDVVLFVMDAREGVTDQDLKLLGYIIESGRSLVIALNKWDGMTTDERDRAKETIDRRLNFVPFVRIHFISALHGSGVGTLFGSVDEAYESANRKLSTPILTRILQEALVQHSPPLISGRRIKLRYAHPGGHNPPRIIIHGNQVKSLPDSYKRYLAGIFQERLKLKGTPVYIELKASENPYREKRNVLTDTQRRKKARLIKHVKR